MFDIFFGWRKASKCKKLIKRVQCRLKLLKNKRHTIAKQLREDVAELIKLGYEETAFNRAEQLLKDESMIAVYDMLDHFCEFVNIQLSYIRRHKDCPNDINEAVSSLIFASARCADLPELSAIRKLFGERYGQRFATAAVELLPGNLVNREIKEKLSIKSVSDDVKYRLIDEIARDYRLQPEILALEYIPEMQRQVKETSGDKEMDRNKRKTEGPPQMRNSDSSEIEGKSVQVDPLAMSASLLISQCQSYSYPNSDAICTSLSSSQRPSPDKMEIESPDQIKARQMDSPFQLTADSPGGGESQSISWICTTTFKQTDERIKAPSSSESLPQFSEEVVVYLDDIEELQSSQRKGDCQDQRLFKFKSPIMPERGAVVYGTDGYDENFMDHEVQDEKSSSKTFSKSSNSNGKKSRRRSFSLETSSMKDTAHEIYYEKPCKSSSNHYRKLQKKTTVAESKVSTCELKRPKQPCCIGLGADIQANNFKYNTTRSSCDCSFNSEVNTSSLENQGYICTFDDREEKFPPRNGKRGLRNSGQFPICDVEENLDDKFCHSQCSSNGASNDETGRITMKESTLTQNLRIRSYDNGANVYELFTLPKIQKEKTTGKVKESDAGSHVSCNSSFPSVVSSQTRNEIAPYSRAMTMPQERPREIHRYSNLRSNSLSFHNPNHVHPKLPEYDDIAAKFIALKKEHLLHKQ
ncbi:uncharacterized protein LOC111308443 [Durio zibethinus]|uniref:Uncharacterized protein LOC111308443 n=1 Tax=Durio zibethinus TaxID=66656 RepID=A0A6P6ACD2_DURZI|nr:uncharacterized protein LOC111308443 [Durio zibethinus]